MDDKLIEHMGLSAEETLIRKRGGIEASELMARKFSEAKSRLDKHRDEPAYTVVLSDADGQQIEAFQRHPYDER